MIFQGWKMKLKRQCIIWLLKYDIIESMNAKYEAGRQAGLKEQVNLDQINVTEVAHERYQAGVQAGLKQRIDRDYCENNHAPIRRREAGPGVWICDVCRNRAYAQIFTDQGPSTDKPQAARSVSGVDHRSMPALDYIQQQRGTVADRETLHNGLISISQEQMQQLLRKVEK